MFCKYELLLCSYFKVYITVYKINRSFRLQQKVVNRQNISSQQQSIIKIQISPNNEIVQRYTQGVQLEKTTTGTL